LEKTLSMCGVSFAEQARHIWIPTLVLAGTYDPLMPPAFLRSTVLFQISGARLIALPCGHEIPHEMPKQAAALVEAFLSGLGPSVAIKSAAA
jgi:pimeloyl-ACP methyl ester carboxylesterase